MNKKQIIHLKVLPLLLTFHFLLLTSFCFSQSGAAINTTGAAAHSSAILDVSSDNAGMLIPRMTKTQRSGITLPAEGLLIYQTNDTVGFWYHSGGVWKLMGSGAGSAMPTGTNAGNTLYWDGSVWVESSNIYNDGISVGIGTSSPEPTAKVEINSSNSGFLIPRMTTAERNAIPSPIAEGLQIFNTDTKCFEAYISPMWQSTFCGCTPPSTPTAGTHTPSQTEIAWNWGTVSGATGYQWNTTNTYPGLGINTVSNSTYSQGSLTCGTAYTLYVWAYNSCGYSTSVELNSSTTSCWSCNVGDSKEGGIVFYHDVANNKCYVSATSDQSTGSRWGCKGTTIGGTGTAIGTGQSNTTAIISGCSTSGIAARICDGLTAGGYSDWFLPSKDELNEMYSQKSSIGDLASDNYWSSSE